LSNLCRRSAGDRSDRGPLANAAIRQFQQAETGIVDGRVDVNGPSIKRLEYLHIERIDSQVYTLLHYSALSIMPPAIPPPPPAPERVSSRPAPGKSQD